MIGPLSYDTNDVIRRIEEEHHALRAVSRWLQSLLGREGGTRVELELSERALLRDFLVGFRVELSSHFEREETSRLFRHSTLGERAVARLVAQHAEMLACVDAICGAVDAGGAGSYRRLVELVDSFLCLLGAHEAEELEMFLGPREG